MESVEKTQTDLYLVCINVFKMLRNCVCVCVCFSVNFVLASDPVENKRRGGSGRSMNCPRVRPHLKGLDSCLFSAGKRRGPILQRQPSRQSHHGRARGDIQTPRQSWALDMGKGTICRFMSWEPNWSGKLRRTARGCSVPAHPSVRARAHEN